jgi:hypothetical protein
MSEETSSIIRSRVALFDNLEEHARENATKARQGSIRNLEFHKAQRVLPTEQHPTGNPDLVSITGYIPGPRGVPANWVKKTDKRAPKPAAASN